MSRRKRYKVIDAIGMESIRDVDSEKDAIVEHEKEFGVAKHKGKRKIKAVLLTEE